MAAGTFTPSRSRATAARSGSRGRRRALIVTGVVAVGTVGLLVYAILRPPAPELTAAAGEIARLEGKRDLAALGEALRSPDAERAALAAGAMGRVGGASAGAPLQAALGDPRADVRRAAALGLGTAGSRQATPALLAALGDADPGVRAAAATALGRLRPWAAVDSLTKAVVDDAHGPVRAAALTALSDITGLRLDFPVEKSLGERKRALARLRQTVAMAKPMYDAHERERPSR